MIDYISGKISELSPTQVIIENQGIGYISEISLQTYSRLEGKKDAIIYVQQQINQRDGSYIEYGFATRDERELFRLITSVSGMGAATARMILSTFSAEEFAEAIISEDYNKLKSVKGLGIKSAQRLVLELKDKLIKSESPSENTIFVSAVSEVCDEAMKALVMLGFQKQNISKVLQQILKEYPSAKVEDLIKLSLKRL